MTAPEVGQNAFAYELLTAEFPDSQVKSFNGAKPGKPDRWLSYVPDETVMDRLDAVFGPGRWSVTVNDCGAQGVAMVTLGVKWPDNADWTYYSDFGYPTNGERGEALKESAGDGIRRCARYLGVARYIYAGEKEAAPPPQQQRQQAPRQQPREPMRGPDGSEWDNVDEPDAEEECAKHGVKWYGDPESGRYHKNGTDEDSGKTLWCRHAGDAARRKASGQGRR